MMKRTLFALLLLLAFGTQAQDKKDDSTRAAAVIDRYLSLVDYTRYKTDSVLCVVSYAIDQAHPDDTMVIYHWYKQPDCIRFEVWQGGMLADGFFTDGDSVRRSFSTTAREWMTLTPESVRGIAELRDIRGALFHWREKGAEVHYEGEYTFEGHKVDRVYVTCPGYFDRHYCFEHETGLLFMVTEDERLYGDLEIKEGMHRIDIRGWHEFQPFRGCLLPSIESYQAGRQKVVIRHSYSYQVLPPTLFTDDYVPHKK